MFLDMIKIPQKKSKKEEEEEKEEEARVTQK